MTERRYVEKDYLKELSYRLARRGLALDKIGDILAEVETHVAVTGEPAREAFGPPAEYARNWERRLRVRRRVTVCVLVLSAGFGWAISVGISGVIDGKPTLGLGAWWWLGIGLVLLGLAALAAALRPHAWHTAARGREQRREVLVAAGASLIFVVGFVSVIGGALMVGRGDPVVGLGHWWLIVPGLALVVAAASIVPLARVLDPRSGKPFFCTRLGFVLTVAVLTVLVTVAFLGVGLALR